VVGGPGSWVWELEVWVDPLAAQPASVEMPDLFAVLQVSVIAGSAHMTTALSVHVSWPPVV